MTEIVSHYELRRLLGRGGMGEVYEAFDLKARRAVALKFVAPELAAEPEALRRFEAEALSAAAMNHPNIATIYEFEPEGSRPFIAMEMVSGPSLRDRIQQGPMGIGESLAIARDVAGALAYAHRRGIVHRDIKPENLMFDEEGRVKVMDFGLARTLTATRLTVVGTSLGTPSYMSPESIHGNSGPPADVFALGIVLAEMLTGQRVFSGETPLAEMFAIANLEPPPLRERRPDAPEAVEALAARLIVKDPEQRPDALTAAHELATLTGFSPSQIAVVTRENEPAPAAPAVATPSPAAAATSVAAPASPARGSRRALWVTLPILIAILGAGALLWRARAGEASRARLQQAMLLNNQSTAAWRTGNLDEAIRLVNQALASEPEYPQALFNRANLYREMGKLDSAAALYDHVLRGKPKDRSLMADVYYNLGDIDLEQDLPDQAVAHLQQSFAIDSARYERYNNLAFALIEAGRPGEALPLLERGIARFSGAAALYKNAGLACLSLDRDAEALVFLDRALARDARIVSARGLRARAKARLGDRPGALGDWRIYAAALPPPRPEERAEVERDLAQHGVPIAATP